MQRLHLHITDSQVKHHAVTCSNPAGYVADTTFTVTSPSSGACHRVVRTRARAYCNIIVAVNIHTYVLGVVQFVVLCPWHTVPLEWVSTVQGGL